MRRLLLVLLALCAGETLSYQTVPSLKLAREQSVPTEGTGRSQAGNRSFPTWELRGNKYLNEGWKAFFRKSSYDNR